MVKNNSVLESNSVYKKCFLTVSCMVHFGEGYDEDCYEMAVIRYFISNVLDERDINHHYEISPILIDTFRSIPNNYRIYENIFDDVLNPCISFLENDNHIEAYRRYLTGRMHLEGMFEVKKHQRRKEMVLKRNKIN